MTDEANADKGTESPKVDPSHAIVKDDGLTPFEAKTLNWAKWGFILAVTTLPVAVLTLIVFYRQFREMQTQTEISREIANQAAQDSISTESRSREQLTFDQRAWVGVKETILNAPSHERDGSILIGLTNTGKTPALKVRVSGIVRREWGESLTDVADAEKYAVKSIGILMPGADLTIPANFPHLTDLGISYVKDGKIRMVSYGIIHYEDIFKHDRTTTLCIYMTKDFQHVEPCSKYNDAN